MFLLIFKSCSPPIAPQSIINLSGIEVRKLLERSRLTKESIWQRRGRKSEEERETPDKEISVMEEFPGVLMHVTPLHKHGSWVTSHFKAVLFSRALERLIMVVFWFEGNSEKTTEHNKKKKNKQKWSRGVLCPYLFILAT
jgi:hypothetical protein